MPLERETDFPDPVVVDSPRLVMSFALLLICELFYLKAYKK